ncbi:MAG: methionyl-tRNA formyltransferase [Lachnospiraceae bacterium]|nr:methionyl-tRNA formyltransferase [Lachnospiraceae bacterium]
MKIVFMGTPDFAAVCLEALYEAGHEITCVVTQPDRPKGRKKELCPSPVKECALKRGTPLLQPEKIRQPEQIQALKAYEADLFVVAAFGQILPREILDMPRLGCINVHASLLPKYRGAAPIQQAILDGEKETGVTIMQMAEGLDTGDILTKRVCPISEEDTGGSLFDKLADLGAALLTETIPLLEAGSITPQKQDDSLASYVKMLKKEDGLVDFSKDAEVLFNQIRALQPWPGAFLQRKGKKIGLLASRVIDGERQAKEAEAGSVISSGKEGIDIQCGKGILRITMLKPEGKKAMSAGDYLLGHKLEKGECFAAE